MTDLREYSDIELSLWVFNTESLYDIRHSSEFETVLRDMFTFTEMQYKILVMELQEDLEEVMNAI